MTCSLLMFMHTLVVWDWSDSQIGTPLLTCAFVYMLVKLDSRGDSDPAGTN